MTVKMHVNSKDEVRKCRAIIKCRYSSEHHFNDEASAIAFVEEKLRNENLDNTFARLTKASSKPITESPSGSYLLEDEERDSKSSNKPGTQNHKIMPPASRDFNKIELLQYTFFQKNFEGKTGIPMEHTILANPKIHTSVYPWAESRLTKGVICRTDTKLERGLNDQHYLNYSIIETFNIKTGLSQNTLFIDAISVPNDSRGQGLALELIDEMCEQYPDLQVPESYDLTQDGKDFRKKLQAARGDKFAGCVSGSMEFDPDGENEVGYFDNDQP